jgi:delta14-sterol reductase
MVGTLALVGIYAATFALYLAVPGRVVEGYVKDAEGRPLRYRLNGLLVFALIVGLYFTLGHFRLWRWDFLYLHRWETLAAAFAVGIAFTLAIVLPRPKVRSLAADLYLGRAENPQWWRADAKMFLYLIGAAMLELNLLSFAAHHYLLHRDDYSPGVILYVALFSFFLVEYLFFERVHLYTYDFVAERVGFKLGWGCLVFYPFFYCVGLWYAAEKPNPHSSPALLVFSAILFFLGWTLARGANMQKYYFKTAPEKSKIGFIEQRAIGNGRVLVSGFWGLSRHINYLGELCMASGLALSLGYPGSIWPWLYPIYYLVLLIPRQIDDDKRCAQKYGPLWDEYRRAVPYRIIPWIY